MMGLKSKKSKIVTGDFRDLITDFQGLAEKAKIKGQLICPKCGDTFLEIEKAENDDRCPGCYEAAAERSHE